MKRRICPKCRELKVIFDDLPMCLDCREDVMRRFTPDRSLGLDPDLIEKRRRIREGDDD